MVVAFSNIRRRTAEHMVRSKHTSAHTVVAMEVDYSAVDAVRRSEKEHFKASEGFSLTYLPFIARAVIDAIAAWPNINSSVGDDELIVHNYVNLGIAVDLNFEGLARPASTTPTASACGSSPARSPVWPAGPGPSDSAPTTSPAARSPSPTPVRSAR